MKGDDDPERSLFVSQQDRKPLFDINSCTQMDIGGLANQAEYEQLMNSQDVNLNAMNDEGSEAGQDSDHLSQGFNQSI